MLCPSGTYKQQNLCIPCLPGTYNPYEDQLKCKPCPKSTYNPHGGQIDCITAKNGGYTNTHTGAINRTDCPPGSYNSNVGFGIFPGNASACTFCQPASYNPSFGQTECMAAPNGGYTNFEIGATNYTACPPGSYNLGVGFGYASSQTTACSLAPINYYTNSFGATAPIPCPGGYMSTILGSTNCTVLNSSIVSNRSAASNNTNTSTDPTTAGMLGGIGGGAATVGGVTTIAGITYCLAKLFPGPVEFLQGIVEKAKDIVLDVVIEKVQGPVVGKTKALVERVKGFGKKIVDKSHDHDSNDENINRNSFDNLDLFHKNLPFFGGDEGIEMPLQLTPLLDASSNSKSSSSLGSTSSSASDVQPPYRPINDAEQGFFWKLSGHSASQDDETV